MLAIAGRTKVARRASMKKAELLKGRTNCTEVGSCEATIVP